MSLRYDVFVRFMTQQLARQLVMSLQVELCSQVSSQVIVSKSLILTKDRFGIPDNNFCLGLPDLVSMLYRKVQDGVAMFEVNEAKMAKNS